MRSAKIVVGLLCGLLSGCGAIYQSPRVTEVEGKVQIVAITPTTLQQANSVRYQPKSLPAVFDANAGFGTPRGVGSLPDAPSEATIEAAFVEERLPPPVPPTPYRIGQGDVLAISLPNVAAAAQGGGPTQLRRDQYAVQNDGAVALPDLGRLQVGGLSLPEAEEALFNRLVERQLNPSFSIEVAEFRSSRVSVGGLVRSPGTLSIGLTPLYLDEALSNVGGVTLSDDETVVVRLYRGGELYAVPLRSIYAMSGVDRIALLPGDSLFVDASVDLEAARKYFEEQIKIADLRQAGRIAAVQELNSEVALRRAALNEERDNFNARAEFDAIDRDFVFLTGEVAKQGRYPLPFDRQASLADALYGNAEGINTETGNVAEIYVLRASPDGLGLVTAWNLDARDATNLVLATRFEMRPNDVVFVAEQPVTRWGRVIRQITPTLITTSITQATN
jgi:polysaccharide export outer membrane protein